MLGLFPILPHFPPSHSFFFFTFTPCISPSFRGMMKLNRCLVVVTRNFPKTFQRTTQPLTTLPISPLYCFFFFFLFSLLIVLLFFFQGMGTHLTFACTPASSVLAIYLLFYLQQPDSVFSFGFCGQCEFQNLSAFYILFYVLKQKSRKNRNFHFTNKKNYLVSSNKFVSF